MLLCLPIIFMCEKSLVLLLTCTACCDKLPVIISTKLSKLLKFQMQLPIVPEASQLALSTALLYKYHTLYQRLVWSSAPLSGFSPCLGFMWSVWSINQPTSLTTTTRKLCYEDGCMEVTSKGEMATYGIQSSAPPYTLEYGRLPAFQRIPTNSIFWSMISGYYGFYFQEEVDRMTFGYKKRAHTKNGIGQERYLVTTSR